MYLKSISDPPKEYPDTDELKSAYEARKDSFIVPHQFKVSQIFIVLHAGADKAAIDKAQGKLEAIIKSLKEPDADFAAIAHAQSDDKGARSKAGTWAG